MNVLQEFDTIAAVATPAGTGGVGIVRVSGDKSFEIIEKIFSKKNLEHGRIAHGRIYEESLPSCPPALLPSIDEVIVLPFRKPNSYTGEDVIEIHCHGGIQIVRSILELVLKNGARGAQRGEFTKRAFLNGKLDLSQAEAVADVIHAKTRNFAHQSAQNLFGVLGIKIKEIRTDIFNLLSQIVAGIDFPDEVSEPEYGYLTAEFEKIIGKIDEILEYADSSNVLRQGIKVAIAGRPNVGKSSLFNAFLNMERAIVTDIAGTTRDILTETLDWDLPVTFIDTAGIREGAESVEKIGIEYSKNSAASADLVLFVYDAAAGFNQEDEAILELFKDKQCLIAANKIDLVTGGQEGRRAGRQALPSAINLSTFNKQGLDELKTAIKEFALGFSAEDTEFITNTRQQDCLQKSRQSITQALSAAQAHELQDLISIDLKSALLFLDEITGEVITDEILNNIFENFCIGK